MLFVGYILGQVPSNLLLNYVGRPSFYLGGWTIAWGLVSLLTSQVKNATGIIVCRFVLGLCESPFFAGVIFYLSRWYTKEELNFRSSLFFSASMVSGAFGSLIAAGILKGLNGTDGYAAWQWLYIIEGSITIAVGILICCILPDFPHTWGRLSPQMKELATRRLAIDAAEADLDDPGASGQLKGLKMAMTDVKTYLLALAYMCQTGAAGFQFFFPTLTALLGYSHIISLLLVAPPYIFIVFVSYFHGLASDKLQKRFWFWCYPIPITIAGWVIFMSTKDFGARYFSFFLMVWIFCQNGTIYAWIASSISRPPAKRAAAFAFINAVGNSASIWTPFTYQPKDAPFYRPALGVAMGLQIVGGLAAVALRVILERENRKLDRLEQEDSILTGEDVKRLQRTAAEEGVDLAEARRFQKSYRYTI